MRILSAIFIGLCSSASSDTKIVGGQEADAHSMPYMVSFGGCGGTILSSRWILSAAHCFYGSSPPDTLDIGVHDIDHSGKSYEVESVHLHSGYDSIDLINDFALIYLAEDIIFDDTAGIAYLPAANQAPQTPPGTLCHVAGWGNLDYGGSSPNELHYVNLDIFDDEVCQNAYPLNSIWWFHQPSQFCAGHVDGNIDACQGDSGGPLICEINEKPVLYGVVSWGIGCGEKEHPGVYSKVSSAIDWIQSFNVDASFAATAATTSTTTYPSLLFHPIRRAIKNSPVWLTISEEDREKFLGQMNSYEIFLGSTATTSMHGKIVSGTSCGKESIMENPRWKKAHRATTKKVKSWNSMLDNDNFQKKFCKRFRTMLNRILAYARNSGYKCEMNGHADPFDQSKSGDEDTLKMELISFAEHYLKAFQCQGYSVNYY